MDKNNLGLYYLESDKKKGIKLLKESKTAESYFNLALAQPEKEVKYYTKAAALGNMDAIYNLGLIHLDNKKYKLAFKHFQKVAKTGHLDAIHNLGLMYYKGLGIDKNENIGESLLRIK